MMDFLIVIFTILISFFSLFVIQQWILVFLYFRSRKEILSVPIPGESPASPSDPVDLPKVTVQVPVYNERYMVERIIEATAKLDYPHNLLQIQILDDSTDDTVSIAQKAVAEWRGQGINIELIHRDHRSGFKAGALNDGLKVAHGELIAIFDADFVPHSNFLRRIICDYRAFDDPRVGFAQTRWVFLNRNKNFVTRGEALLLETHFLLDNLTRQANGMIINFNGSGGIWRTECIHDAGGWELDTLSEDMDLNYRAHLKGWKGVYFPHEESPNELPDTIMAFKQQWRRWSRGPTQCFRKLFWKLLRSSLSWKKRFNGIMYMSNVFMHPIQLAFILIWPILAVQVWITQVPVWLQIFFPMLTIFLASFYVMHHTQGRSLKQFLIDLPSALTVICGTVFSNSWAVMQGLFLKQTGVFERTPKKFSDSTKESEEKFPEPAALDQEKSLGRRITNPNAASTATAYSLKPDWTVWVETCIAIYLLAMTIPILLLGSWINLLPILIYTCAFTAVSVNQLLHLWRDSGPVEKERMAPSAQASVEPGKDATQTIP